MKLIFLAVATLCLAATPLRAELRLTGVITDHAVLQRDVPIHVWGDDSPAARITISFHGQSIATTANNLGLWEAWLCWWAMCGLPPGSRIWKCRFPDFPPVLM